MTATAKPRQKRKGTSISTALGKRMKACRIEANKSQEQLAHEALVDRSYVSTIERGVGNPSIETLANLAYCMNLTLAKLFEPLEINLRPTGTRRANAAEPEKPNRRRLR
ncbi:helix-turn-helix domain-containing protein [Paraburkholderia flava]|uniref:helix-turn-helix domain-containing protein n=1 Tax=Paraburkholderia flava TaxID=2547393 RepID=UPI001F0F33F2|nr:helix-turn-helix transcriptional regulator [Paraburkholderia flava]